MKSVDSLLSKITGSVGFIIFLLSMCMNDYSMFPAQVALFMIGLAMLLWSAYEDGYFRTKRK